MPVLWTHGDRSLLLGHRGLICLLGMPDLPDDQVEHVNQVPEHRQYRKNAPDRGKHFLFPCVPVDEKRDEQLHQPADDHNDEPGERLRRIHVWHHNELSGSSHYMLSRAGKGPVPLSLIHIPKSPIPSFQGLVAGLRRDRPSNRC